MTASAVAGVEVEADRQRLLYDEPVRLPASRGPVSQAFMELLDLDPETPADDHRLHWRGGVDTITTDDDLQLSLWLLHELSYRGLSGVSEEWEGQPALTSLRNRWQGQLFAGLRHDLAELMPAVVDPAPTRAQVVDALETMATSEDGPSVATWLMKNATAEQFREFLVHRSIYHLKEADPHSWAIPRLSGAVKAAMVTIQTDEYGLGRTTQMHAQLFRTLMIDWGLDCRYGGYLDQVPGVTLLGSNLISMFGLERRWRGALVGHLSLFEMTSSAPNARYARAHRRLGGGEEAALFFDEHVVADAVHEQIAAHQLAGGLAATEPQLGADIVFGARCGALTDRLFADYALPRWSRAESSLRSSGDLW